MKIVVSAFCFVTVKKYLVLNFVFRLMGIGFLLFLLFFINVNVRVNLCIPRLISRAPKLIIM